MASVAAPGHVFLRTRGKTAMTDPLYRQTTAGYALAPASDKTTVVVVYALYLAGFLTAGLTTLIGLVMTYVLRGEASDIARTHYVFLARTFWKGLLFSVLGWVLLIVGLPLSFILIGIPLLMAAKLVWVLAAVWYGARCVMGLLAALGDRPYGAPRSWVI
jgi:uncharacterized membrane protein